MSLLDHFFGTVGTLTKQELDDKSRFGALGEQFARQVISQEPGTFIFSNPILPHPRKPGVFIEEDFLVFTQGSLYCIEIKNYKGVISYPQRNVMQPVKERFLFFFTRTVMRPVGNGFDEDHIIQHKVSKYGDKIYTKEYPNPYKKNNYFIRHLKDYLKRIDPRFNGIYITSLVGFGDEADIRAIYDPKGGMIHTREIPRFFAEHANPRIASNPPPWIIQGLQQLPTWDRIYTISGNLVYGILKDRELVFHDGNGRKQRLAFTNVYGIQMRRHNGHEELIVNYLNGQEKNFGQVIGTLQLEHFGNVQQHPLSNINWVTIGIANHHLY